MTAAPAIEGHADGADPGFVRGWAWTPERPDRTLEITLLAPGGAVAGTAAADAFRGDLQSAGKRDGRCAFAFELPRETAGPFVLVARDPTGEAPSLELASGIPSHPARAQAVPVRLKGAGVEGWVEGLDATGVSGWAHAAAPFGPPLRLELVEDGHVVGRGVADRWRTDLEELRLGDGRCGFRLRPDDALYDGREHALELRLEGGEGLLPEPLRLALPPAPPPGLVTPEPRRPPPGAAPLISVVVNFFNMRREAERTLLSLSRRVQRDVEHIAYEVICVDNGSDPPLEPAFVEGFGPEFRLVRPERPRPSPCGALNAAAAQAKGRFLALMIDGAHILSPGVLAEAALAFEARPRAVVALRQWFVGGDQRWFSSVGYSSEREDLLFARIGWPAEPYRIFDISSPMYESPNSWFDGMSESNCLFVPAELFRAIGGFDLAFDTPGAGLANLDLFRRAVDRASDVVALVGEASFHQYHGGMTTNVDDGAKDARVRAYVGRYEDVRGQGFENVPPDQIRLSGGMRTAQGLVARQRLYNPARIALTDRVRPRPASIQFDELAQQYVQAAYVETGRHRETRWAGRETGVSPSDLIDLQEALWRSRPERVLVSGAEPGLVAFVRAALPALGLAETRVVEGEFATLEAEAADAERVMVVLRPAADDAYPLEALRRHARLVSFDGYLLALGAAFGQPWLGYSRQWLFRALMRFCEAEPQFVIDRTLGRHFVTTSPSGFLRRVLKPLAFDGYDARLDELDGI